MNTLKSFSIRILKRIKIPTIIILQLISLYAYTTDAIFKFHLSKEPETINPANIQGSDINYFYSMLFKGLYRYDNKQGLIPEGARSCFWKTKKKLICDLNPKMSWNDGIKVKAEDYIRTLRYLINPSSKAKEVHQLFNIKNAKKIYSGQLKPKTLGVSAPHDLRLIFLFEKEDPEFLFKLLSPVFAPLRQIHNVPPSQIKFLSNGPYYVDHWEKGKKISLKKNPHYPMGNTDRPNIDILIVEDDSTALNLFETGYLDFMRRLPTIEIPRFKKHKGFIQVELARFDYIGFGPELKPYPNLRKALTFGVDYNAFKKLFHALGRPGCPSIPLYFMDKVPCYDFNLKKAKKFLSQVPPSVLKKRWKFYFSKLGGDDLKRVGEFYQGQWKQNLNLKIELIPSEQGLYLEKLKNKPPPIFRKGMNLDRPTCIAALEQFESNSIENYIQFRSSKYDRLIKKLRKKKRGKKKLCRQAIEIWMDSYTGIPQGRIHFTRIMNPNFQGWSFNIMNHFELADLKSTSK